MNVYQNPTQKVKEIPICKRAAFRGYRCIGYLGQPFAKLTTCSFITLLFFFIMWYSTMKEAGGLFSGTRERPSYEKTLRFLAANIQGSHARLHYQSAKGTFIYNAARRIRLVHPQYFRIYCADSGYPLIIMVKPTQDRNSNHLVSSLMRGMRRSARFRNLLLNPLMRSGLIEVRHIPMKYTLKLFLVKEQQVVKTFLSYAPHEALTDCIGSRSAIGCFENLYGARCSHPSEARPKFAIVITNEVLRCLPIGSGFPKLLRHPSVGRGSGNADMNHSACLEFDDEEGKKGSKEEIRHLQEVTSPDVLGMVVQECPPLLPPWQRSVSRAHVLLDGSFAHLNAQFQ
jgi:hypothetical protein